MNPNGPVVLFGEAIMSLTAQGDRPIERGSPMQLTFAGAEVNVAIGLTRLGHWARWVGVLGDDPFGKIVVKGLRGEGVDVSRVSHSHSGPTALMVKCPRPGAEPEVLYYRKGSAMGLSDPELFPYEALSDSRLLYATGITPALSDSCNNLTFQIVADAARLGVPIWLDPNHRRKLWSEDDARKTLLKLIPKTELVLCGIGEGAILTGHREPVQIGKALLRMGALNVVVKAGPHGAWYFGLSEEIHVPAFPVARVVDPVGAGDGFGAGILSARLDGLGWSDALRRGHALGAIVCQTAGDWEGLPDRQRLEDFMLQRDEAVR